MICHLKGKLTLNCQKLIKKIKNSTNKKIQKKNLKMLMMKTIFIINKIKNISLMKNNRS